MDKVLDFVINLFSRVSKTLIAIVIAAILIIVIVSTVGVRALEDIKENTERLKTR